MKVNDFDLNKLQPKPREGLGPRELEVFTLFGYGHDATEIAFMMRLSRRTVESHRDHIKAKLGIKSLIKLYQLAYRYVNVS